MSDKIQSWFAARLIFESVHERQGDFDPLFEDRIILVRAMTEDEAREKAKALARSNAERYENAEGDTVTWVFREILDLKWVYDEVLEDGSEVYSSFLRLEELNQLRTLLEADTARA
jgi:hypothetical protein